MATDFKVGKSTKVSVWECFSEPSAPICIAADDGTPSVTVYAKKGGIVAVQVYDPVSDSHVSLWGQLPKKVAQEQLAEELA